MFAVNNGDKVSFRHIQGRNIADNYDGTFIGLFFQDTGHHALIRIQVSSTRELKDFYVDEIRGLKILDSKLTV